MDQTNYQKLSRFTMLLLSISVFSLLISSSNSLSFLPPWHFGLFSFPLRLVTHAVDKSCIFLLCNGILVFLAQDSGFIGTKTTWSWRSTTKNDPPKETMHMMENKLLAMDIDNGVLPNVAQEDSTHGKEEKTLNNNNDNHEDCVLEVDTGDICFHAGGCAGDGNDDNKEEEQEDTINLSTSEERNTVAIPDPDGNEKLDECGGEREDETSEDYKKIRYGNHVMTAEELDKKFEDFIRRMKEGIMIETQQQHQQLLKH